MFAKFKTNAKLDEEIASALDALSQTTDPKKYDEIVDRITQLQKLKSQNALKLPSPDTMLIVTANLAGIWWLTAVEREHPLTSKAMNFVFRLK